MSDREGPGRSKDFGDDALGRQRGERNGYAPRSRERSRGRLDDRKKEGDGYAAAPATSTVVRTAVLGQFLRTVIRTVGHRFDARGAVGGREGVHRPKVRTAPARPDGSQNSAHQPEAGEAPPVRVEAGDVGESGFHRRTSQGRVCNQPGKYRRTLTSCNWPRDCRPRRIAGTPALVQLPEATRRCA